MFILRFFSFCNNTSKGIAGISSGKRGKKRTMEKTHTHTHRINKDRGANVAGRRNTTEIRIVSVRGFVQVSARQRKKNEKEERNCVHRE